MSHYQRKSSASKQEPELKWLERACDDWFASLCAVLWEPIRVFTCHLRDEDPYAEPESKEETKSAKTR